jgi:hypothetical protein
MSNIKKYNSLDHHVYQFHQYHSLCVHVCDETWLINILNNEYNGVMVWHHDSSLV